MAASELVGFLVRGLVDNPDDVTVSSIEGESANILEVRVHPDDIELVKGNDGETLHHIKSLVSAAAGNTKAIVELLETDGTTSAEEE